MNHAGGDGAIRGAVIATITENVSSARFHICLSMKKSPFDFSTGFDRLAGGA